MTRVRTRILEGEPLTYDGTNAREVEAFAGDLYAGIEAGCPVILNDDGTETLMSPGWRLVRWDGGGLTVFAPGAARLLLEDA